MLTWADGFGGLRRDDLEWYLSRGEGAVLTAEMKDLVREGVRRLVEQDRRLAAEAAKEAAKK